MFTMVTKRKVFDQLYLFATFKDEPIPHTFLGQGSFTFLGQGSYEITGGVADPPPPLVSDVVPKPLVSEGLNSTTRMDA